MSKIANINVRIEPEVKQPRYNALTEQAMQEARDIACERVSAKTYSSVSEMMEEIE